MISLENEDTLMAWIKYVIGRVEDKDEQTKEFAEDDLDTSGPYTDDDEADIDEALRELERSVRKGLSELYRFAQPNRNRIDLTKLLDVHRETFQRHMGDLAKDFREGRISYDQWAAKGKAEIEQGVRMAQKIGLAQARGTWPPSALKLTEVDRVSAGKMVNEQLKYFGQFRREVREKLAAGEELTTALDARAKQYAGAAKSASSQATLGAQGVAKLVWVRHKDDSCQTCLDNEGKTKTAAEWERGGVWPAHNTICHGNCGCSLDPVMKEGKDGKLFHLPGKHDQKAHGSGGVFEPRGVEEAEAAYMPAISTLTGGERLAIRDYMSSGYGEINTKLRQGETTSRVEDIDSALAKGVAPRNFVAYRGISNKQAVKLLAGTEFVDRGFVSTSISSREASNWNRSLMIVNVPSGSKGLFVGPLSKVVSEQEFLIPRGSRFRVDSVGDMRDVINVSLMP